MSDTPHQYQYERQDIHEEVPGKRQHAQEGASNASGGSDWDGEGGNGNGESGESGESDKSHDLSPGRFIVPYTGLNSGIPGGDGQPYLGTRARFWALAGVTVVVLTLLAIWGLVSGGGFATHDRLGGMDGVDTVRDTASSRHSQTATIASLAPASTTITRSANLDTLTPAATSTPDPEQVRVRRYAQTWGEWVERYTRSMEELATLSEHPDPWNRQWLASMQRQLNEIASINNEVLTYPSPPAQYAEAHAVLRQAATELENTAHSFSRGVETFDPFLIMQAVERLDSNIERLQEALNTLEDAANP